MPLSVKSLMERVEEEKSALAAEKQAQVEQEMKKSGLVAALSMEITEVLDSVCEYSDADQMTRFSKDLASEWCSDQPSILVGHQVSLCVHFKDHKAHSLSIYPTGEHSPSQVYDISGADLLHTEGTRQKFEDRVFDLIKKEILKG